MLSKSTFVDPRTTLDAFEKSAYLHCYACPLSLQDTITPLVLWERSYTWLQTSASDCIFIRTGCILA